MEVMQRLRRPPRRDHHFHLLVPSTFASTPGMGHPRWHQGALRFLGIVRLTMDFDKKLPGKGGIWVRASRGLVLRRSLDKTTKVIAEYRQDAG
jgi:hypothetical protein